MTEEVIVDTPVDAAPAAVDAPVVTVDAAEPAPVVEAVAEPVAEVAAEPAPVVKPLSDSAQTVLAWIRSMAAVAPHQSQLSFENFLVANIASLDEFDAALGA
jgi:hypothetical protein